MKWLKKIRNRFAAQDYKDPTEPLEIQLIQVTKKSHTWILISNVETNDTTIEIGTRHDDCHLLHALRNHTKLIKKSYNVDITYKSDMAYYSRIILPLLVKSKDFEIEYRHGSKDHKCYLKSMIDITAFIN